MNKKPNVDDSDKLTQSKWANELLNDWAQEMKNIGTHKFNYNIRGEYLCNLVDILIEGGVNYNTAITLTNKIPDSLVTKEGKKGMGKHGNWVENVKNEYRAMILESYQSKKLPINVEDADNAGLAVVGPREVITETVIIEPTYGDSQHLKQRAIITAWAKHRFDYFYNSQLDLLAHRIGHELNVMFQKEVLKSEWLVTRKDVPEWAVAILSE
jgi:hypothetical protein